MNDEFLYRLRKQPRREFARDLKVTLRRQEARSAVLRRSSLRILLAAVLVGGSALAAVFFVRAPGIEPGVHERRIEVDLAATSRRNPSSAVRHSLPGGQAAPAPAGVTHAVPGGATGSDSLRHRDDAPAGADPAHMDTPPARAATGDFVVKPGAALPVPPHITIAVSPLTEVFAAALSERWPREPVSTTLQVRKSMTEDTVRLFCALEAPPQTGMVFAARRIEPAELELCSRNGIKLREAKLGYQAIVLAANRASMLPKRSAREIYLALAKRVPDPADPTRLIDNPHATWDRIHPRLGMHRILAFGPALDSQTLRLFAARVLGAGCDTYPWIERLKQTDWERYASICYTLRIDGPYQEVDQASTLVTQQLWAESDALAIVDYRYYEEHRDHLGSVLQGIEPSPAAIAAATYAAASSVYVYADPTRLIRVPGGWELIAEPVSERAIAPWGYLIIHGLIPLSERERKLQRERYGSPISFAAGSANERTPR